MTILFDSRWPALTSSGAVTEDERRATVGDGGKWTQYWEFDPSSSGSLLSVVPGGPEGLNCLKVLQRGTDAGNLQVDTFIQQSRSYFARFYFKTDDTSQAGDHIATVDTFNYANLTFLRKEGGALSFKAWSSLYGVTDVWSIAHWGPPTRLANGRWWRFEFHVEFVDATHVRLHPRVYDETGALLFTEADYRHIGYGNTPWNGRQDWTLASYYSAGHSFAVRPQWLVNFGLGNNGQAGAVNTGLAWYFAAVQIRDDDWCGPVVMVSPPPPPPPPEPVPDPVLSQVQLVEAEILELRLAWDELKAMMGWSA